jgi:hypothetical protein
MTLEMHLVLQLHVAEIAELWTILLGIFKVLVPEVPCYILIPIVSLCAELNWQSKISKALKTHQ